MHYHIGIDGGGSGCRAILADADGSPIGKGTAGPANIGADTTTALRNITAAAEQAAHNAGLTPSILSQAKAVLGLAGANSLPDRDALYGSLPFAQCHIVSDAVTALQGAIGDGDGAIVILGTGSAFVRRAGDETRITGGRGFMLSDHAGGARLGRELLEETLLACDGMADGTLLTEAVLSRFDNDPRAVTLFSRTATAADYAAFAPLLFEYAAQQDPLGLSILRRACASVSRGLDALDMPSLGRFSMTGGLATAYAALPFFPYREFYVLPLGDSLQGALSLALRAT